MPTPPKEFVFSDDDDEQVEGGGIPDDDGWIHLEGKPDGGLGNGDSRKRKAVSSKPKLVSSANKRTPRRRPGGA